MMTLVIYGAVAMGLVFGLGVCVGCIVELKAKIKEDKELEELKDGEEELYLIEIKRKFGPPIKKEIKLYGYGFSKGWLRCYDEEDETLLEIREEDVYSVERLE